MEADSPYKAPEADIGGGAQTDDLREAFVGPKNTHYYLNQFEKFDSGGGSIGWHWPAFFVTWVWLGYRKMWGWFFAYWFLFPFIMALLGGFATVAHPIFGAIVYLGGYFLIPPLFANRLYYGHARNKTAQAQLSSTNPQAQAQEAARLGGTSMIVLIVLPLIIAGMVGILAAIAIPTYQDYTIRAQVSEGLNLSGGAKAAVSEYILDAGSVPADNAEAGLADPRDISGRYTSAIEVYQGEINITYGNEAHEQIYGREIYLIPEDVDGNIEWSCGSSDIAAKHLPAACR